MGKQGKGNGTTRGGGGSYHFLFIFRPWSGLKGGVGGPNFKKGHEEKEVVGKSGLILGGNKWGLRT